MNPAQTLGLRRVPSIELAAKDMYWEATSAILQQLVLLYQLSNRLGKTNNE
jgi:hypothetical protein